MENLHQGQMRLSVCLNSSSFFLKPSHSGYRSPLGDRVLCHITVFDSVSPARRWLVYRHGQISLHHVLGSLLRWVVQACISLVKHPHPGWKKRLEPYIILPQHLLRLRVFPALPGVLWCIVMIHKDSLLLIQKSLFAPYLLQDFILVLLLENFLNYGFRGRLCQGFRTQCAVCTHSILRLSAQGNFIFSWSRFSTNTIIDVELFSNPSSMPWILISSHLAHPSWSFSLSSSLACSFSSSLVASSSPCTLSSSSHFSFVHSTVVSCCCLKYPLLFHWKCLLFDTEALSILAVSVWRHSPVAPPCQDGFLCRPSPPRLNESFPSVKRFFLGIF